MLRDQDRPLIDGDPPLGSAPGYGDVMENVVGEQGSIEPSVERCGCDESKFQRISETPLYKEELLPEEKGTSLDEGGAG